MHNKPRRAVRQAGVFLIIIAASACSPSKSHQSAGSDTKIIHAGNVVRCQGFETGEQLGPQVFPLRLETADIKARLTHSEFVQAKKIIASHQFKNLRIVWLVPQPNEANPIIFDADQGDCPNAGVRYGVLNSWPPMIYQPGENPFRVRAITANGATPYPWLNIDK